MLFASSGIEDDIKVWDVTLDSPRPPGEAAEQQALRNLQNQGSRHSRSYIISAAVMRELMGENRGDTDDPRLAECVIS